MIDKLIIAQNYIPPGVVVPASGPALTLGRSRDLLVTISNYLIIFSVIFAVIFIVWSGISYMMAQGGSTDDAKKKLTNAIIGTAIVLGVGLIIRTIASLITQQFFCIGIFGC